MNRIRYRSRLSSGLLYFGDLQQEVMSEADRQSGFTCVNSPHLFFLFVIEDAVLPRGKPAQFDFTFPRSRGLRGEKCVQAISKPSVR